MTSKEEIVQLIVAKGDEIREMKAAGSTKDEVMKHVVELQNFKKLYEVNAVQCSCSVYVVVKSEGYDYMSLVLFRFEGRVAPIF